MAQRPASFSLPVLDAVLRKEFVAFARKCFLTLNVGAAFEANWHHQAIAHQLERCRNGDERRLLINVQPRSLKSHFASVSFPAFVPGHNPAARIACVSYADNLSSDLHRQFRIVVQSDWYRRIFPGTRFDRETQEELVTTANGGRRATSVGGALTGFGADIIILDDPQKAEEAASEVAREKTIRLYRETLISRLNNKKTGVIILVSQRLHENDLSGHVIEEGGWHHLRLSARAESDETIDLGRAGQYERKAGDLLHPDREDEPALRMLERALGTAGFMAQYQQSPVPADGNLVKRESLRYFQNLPPRDGMRIVQSIDTALKTGTANDYSVVLTFYAENDVHYLVDVWRDKVTYPVLRERVKEQHAKHRPSLILIEDQGAGTSLIQDLQQESISCTGWRSKDDKRVRFETASPTIEGGGLHILEGAPWREAFERELLGFPAAKHDDQVDALSQYLLWSRDRRNNAFEAFWP